MYSSFVTTGETSQNLPSLRNGSHLKWLTLLTSALDGRGTGSDSALEGGAVQMVKLIAKQLQSLVALATLGTEL